ncbi:BPH1 [Malassezia furfur]|nr:BPH1 [Malassezia furfur]
MGEPGRGRRAPRAVPASPLFLDVEFAKMRDAAPSPPASTEGVAALNAALLQAQISSPIVSASAWDDGAEPDRAGARLTELVEALHKCPATDYTEMHRGAARVYEGFGRHGGFLVVMQVLSFLQRGADDAARVVRSQLLLRALTLLCDAITYSRANLFSFAHMPGWDGFLHSLELATGAGAAQTTASRLAALLFGLATGDVAGGAQHFGAVWRALPEVLAPDATVEGVRARLPHWRTHALVHPRAIEGALRIAAADDVVLLASYALLTDLTGAPRNVVVLARSPLVSRMLRAWLDEGVPATPTRALVHAWRAHLLETVLCDGIRASEDVQLVLQTLTSAPLDTQLPLLHLLRGVARSAYRPSALTFAPSTSPGGGGAGYSIAVTLRVDRADGDGTLDLVTIGDRVRLALDLRTLRLVYATAAPTTLERAQLVLHTWHHVVLTHARAAAHTPSTLHVRRACGAPASATWLLSSLLLQDGVMPSSVPLLLAVLPPQYMGNLQGALARFLPYAAQARMERRLAQLAAANAHAPGHGETLAGGHARILGVPTITVPRDVGDAVWAAGGAVGLLQLVERAESGAALEACVRLLLELVSRTWRLAADAERVRAYHVLGLLLRDRAAWLTRGTLDALLDACVVRGALCNVPLYRAVLLDACLWAQVPTDVQAAYLAHFRTVLRGATGAANAQRLAKAPVLRRVLYVARLAPHRADTMQAPLADAVHAVLHALASARSVQALLLFAVAYLAPWTPPAPLRAAARTDADDVRSVECAAARVPPAQPSPDARLARLAHTLLLRFIDVYAGDAARLARLARWPSARWLVLLVRPGIAPEIAAPVLALVAQLLPHARFREQWDAHGGFRVLERALPPMWDAPDVLPALWHMLLGAREPRASLYATYAPHAPLAPLAYPAALRVLLLCIAEGLAHERTEVRHRRRSLPASPQHAAASARRVRLQESVQLLVAYAPHPEMARGLLVAPSLLCLLHALTPLLATDGPPPSALVTVLCTDLLEMLAVRIAASITASGTISLLTSAHQAMPTPDPVLQSRLCARLYTRVVAHVFPLPAATRRMLSMGAALLKLATNESIGDVPLQNELFVAGAHLLDAAAAHPGYLTPRSASQAAVAMQRNVLHAFASTPLDARTSPPCVFCATYWAHLEANTPFVQCVANRIVARLRTVFDGDAATALLLLAETHPDVVADGALAELIDALRYERSIALPAAPFAEVWAATEADQALFRRGLHLDRATQLHASLFKPSARAQGVLTTHARLAQWHASVAEADRVQFARYAQDLRDDAHYVRQAWMDASEALALQRGAPHDWQLDTTEGPGRARLKLFPVMPSDAVPTERSADAALPAELAELAPDDVGGTRRRPPGAAGAPAGAPTPATPPVPLPDDADDTYRIVLRSLHHGDTAEALINASRVLGIETRGCLVVASARHLYVLDDYFQRPSGEIVHVADVPTAERDELIAAAFASAQPSSAPLEHAAVLCWAWDALTLCLRRAWLHRLTALELFFADGRSCLLVLADAAHVEQVLALVRAKARRALTEAERMADGLPSPRVLRRAHAAAPTTRAWQEGRLSNAAYLMALNTLAGRTMNDLTQFPVFPWVLADYTSGTLDLDTATTFRDLARPMGAQTEARRTDSAERYQQLLEVNMDPFHYGTHYSTAASVCGFLVRLRPFAHWLIELQGGSFDLADRMFASVGRAYHSASAQARGDVRELIPEFFFLPELFLNTNHFALGRTQAGSAIDDVELPPWAHDDPWLFVQLHREALESPYVSAHLHEWIDLVFGCKARGQAAVDALNVFHPLSYADSVDVARIDSPLEREAAAQVIHNFGQTPRALFARPHPMRDAHTRDDLAHTPHLLVQARAPTAHLGAPALLPDGLLTYGHLDGSLHVVPAQTPNMPHVTEQAAPARITAVAVVGTTHVVVGAEDGTVQLFGLHAARHELEPCTVWSGHAAAVVCAAASATWRIAVTGAADHTAIVWDVTRQRYTRTLRGHAQPLAHVAIDDERGYIATAAGDEVCMYSINGHLFARQSTRAATRRPLSALAFCARDFHVGGLAVLVTGHAGQLLVWRVASNHEATPKDAPRWRLALMATLDAHGAAPITAVHVATHDTLCTGDEAGDVYTWSLPGAAVTPPRLPEGMCMNASCQKRFGFLELKRTCGACGGVFCSACTVPYKDTRLCTYCAATLSARGLEL